MEGLFSECGPKIFSRGRNKTKLLLFSKQLFTDGVLLQRAQGEAELRWRSFIFDSYHASPRVRFWCASNRPGSPSHRCLARPACRSDPHTSTGRAASLETTSTAPRSKNTALVGFWELLIWAAQTGAVWVCYSCVWGSCLLLPEETSLVTVGHVDVVLGVK